MLNVTANTFDSTFVAKSRLKAKELAEKILAKANDKSAKFPNSKASSVCPSCLGSGTRYVYNNGKRLAKRCEGATWNKEKKIFICVGNADWQKIELANKKDLLNQIWKIVMHLKKKQSFLSWLHQEYQTEHISSFSLQQLEFILNKVKAQTIFANQETSRQEEVNPKLLNTSYKAA